MNSTGRNQHVITGPPLRNPRYVGGGKQRRSLALGINLALWVDFQAKCRAAGYTASRMIHLLMEEWVERGPFPVKEVPNGQAATD